MGVELALEWASAGHRVLPVNGTTKRPLIKAWQQECSTDPDKIRAWWDVYPEARVGIATGHPGFDVVDFDVSDGKPGLEQLEKLLDAGVFKSGSFALVETPSGGRHALFRGSEQRNKQNEKAIPGVDFRGAGGMVVAAGNPGYRWITGRSYDIENMAQVDWGAVARCLVPEQPQPTPPSRPNVGTPSPVSTSRLRSPETVPVDNAPGEESPLDWYCRNHDIGKLLLDRGWQFAYTDQGRDYWVRPGKKRTDGISANVMINPDGRQTLVNYSTSVDLPTDRGMSAAQLYGWLEHGGNMAEAARTIRTTMMPRPAPTTRPVVQPTNEDGAGAPTPGPLPADSAEDTTGRELVPVSEAGPPSMVRDFWGQRPELREILHLARERRVAPWACLGAVLALVSCRVGPHVVLPPIVGGVASLNLLVGLVGPSGKGKGAAWAVAEEYLGVRGKFVTEEVGTSQGIDSCFTETSPKAGSIQFNDVAFFYVPEIDSFKAHTEMSGSALLPHLRKIWSGEALGARYAKQENRRPVRAHAYRASVVAGIQPARSGVLLNDADGGTPQRWLWLPVHDPDALRRKAKLKSPVYTGQPPAIDFDVWVPQGEQRGEKNEPVAVETQSRYVIPVCEAASHEIIDAREENLVSQHSSMDSHSLLTRLKVAALLAFLDRRAEVRDDDWALSKAIMWVSTDTRAECQRAYDEAEQEEHRRRGRGRAAADVAADVARVQIKDARIDRVQELGLKLLLVLQAHPGREFSPKELRELMGNSRTRRDYWDDVEAALAATPGVVQGPETSSGGRRIRKLSWAASHVALS